MPAGYRIEIDTRHLKTGQAQEFITEAERAGYVVELSGFTLTIVNLNVRQATAIRDGLAELGIHASIGVPVEPKREFENYIPRRDDGRRSRW